MSYHPAGSSSKILLARWLGNMDSNAMMAGSNMTAQDWMFLALTGMGGASQEIGQTYIKKLLHSGDIHTAATIMISLGDYNDAIEIYDSHKRYMEALLLVCLFFPSVWERQKGILRKWERWAAQHGQHQLASKWYVFYQTPLPKPSVLLLWKIRMFADLLSFHLQSIVRLVWGRSLRNLGYLRPPLN